MKTAELFEKIKAGDRTALAQTISMVENESEGFADVLRALRFEKKIPVIGVTGPPGAGKSSLINSFIEHLTDQNKSAGILVVDPSSPFTQGALLGDRVRMSSHYDKKNIYIRSLATRGALGGVSARTIEICDVMKQADFDYIFIETVGVGQSEVEIASMADTTLLVLVPGAGDEVQALKSGIMEIADVFVVNKSDMTGSDQLEKNILEQLDYRKKSTWVPPIVKTIATQNIGIEELFKKIDAHQKLNSEKINLHILKEKAIRLIARERMRNVDVQALEEKIKSESLKKEFNLYAFIDSFLQKS